MDEVPSLTKLCLNSIKSEILHADDIPPFLYDLPSELFDSLVNCLPPVALLKLQEQIPSKNWSNGESSSCCSRNQRKRKRTIQLECNCSAECIRYAKLNLAWKALYQFRWPDQAQLNKPINWLAKQDVGESELLNDWQQMYWQTHLQSCLDEAAELASLPSFDGCISEARISDAILIAIGHEGVTSDSRCKFSKLLYHCERFGCFARCLRLQNVLCVAEIHHFLRTAKLEGLELLWIQSKAQVEGLCTLLNQNKETLKSLEFSHCKFSSTFIGAICDSLLMKDLQTHGVEHFSIKTSRFLDAKQSLPVGLESFLSSGRSLSSLSLCDNRLGRNFAKLVFNTLIDTASCISVLDLSENNIAGWLYQFRLRFPTSSQLPSGAKSLQSLHVLNLRGTNLCSYDAGSLKYALIHVPNLKVLDISDNPLEDRGIMSLIPYFSDESKTRFNFTDLRVENCELSSVGIIELVNALSISHAPLEFLSIGGNDLGSVVGASLGKFLGTGIRGLDIEDIGLGSGGFYDMQKELKEDLKLVYINMSKNRGGVESANCITKLILSAPDLVAVNAGYNFIPFECLPAICSSIKDAKGKLERVDLTGNNWHDQSADPSMLEECQVNGRPVFVLPSLGSSHTFYDDDP